MLLLFLLFVVMVLMLLLLLLLLLSRNLSAYCSYLSASSSLKKYFAFSVVHGYSTFLVPWFHSNWRSGWLVGKNGASGLTATSVILSHMINIMICLSIYSPTKFCCIICFFKYEYYIYIYITFIYIFSI